MPGCLLWRPPPVRVHHSVSIRPIRSSSPSGVRPSGVQPVWCPLSGVRPSGARPSGLSRPAPPASARRWLWGPHRAAAPSRPERVEFHVVPGGSVNGSSRPRRRRRCEGRPQVRSARRRCRSRSWPAVLGRRPRSTLTDQEARPPRGRAWLAAEPRTGAGGDAPFLCLSRGCPLGLDARPLSVVAVEPGAPGGRARKGQRA
jgi:hypothetical protein